jgi:hypothetical protein
MIFRAGNRYLTRIDVKKGLYGAYRLEMLRILNIVLWKSIYYMDFQVQGYQALALRDHPIILRR